MKYIYIYNMKYICIIILTCAVQKKRRKKAGIDLYYYFAIIYRNFVSILTKPHVTSNNKIMKSYKRIESLKSS